MSGTRPRAPQGLAKAGRKVWRQVADAYQLEDFNAAELTQLELAARTMDLVAELAEQVDQEGLTVKGSQGQRRAHPALGELRLQRKLAADLLRQLGLDQADDVDAALPSVRSQRATQAARKRWGTA